ncbi:uncharacterized protein [Drosophila takahashii]|uniref:uncharacterized protein n=1 Tax=Drosophila takahashii TaxID=29030 RepID=UPI001CF87165|nr:uncharacterized protein LOC123002798 [Drosophila takahashii]
MYRCRNVHHNDYQYQRILWRAADGEINEYCLTTVTFGTASAPFTAIRVLHQIGEDENSRYLRARHVLKHAMYIDDMLTGDYTVEAAQDKMEQVSGALQNACMELRKWASNSPSLLADIPVEHRCSSTLLQWDSEDQVKTLGMFWIPSLDVFKYKILHKPPIINTKRLILSNISRLFDPLGLITPIIISAKIILKEIMVSTITQCDGTITGLQWDDPVPSHLAARWTQFLNSLDDINTITISRWTGLSSDSGERYQIHAFCDGSSVAYAAAVYLRASVVEQPAQDRLLEFINNLQKQQEAAVNAQAAAIEKLLERFDQMMSVMTTTLQMLQSVMSKHAIESTRRND